MQFAMPAAGCLESIAKKAEAYFAGAAALAILVLEPAACAAGSISPARRSVNTPAVQRPSRAKPKSRPIARIDDPLHDLLRAMQAVQAGDFSARVSGDWEGVHGKLADTFNDIIAANQRMSEELERINVGVGKQGKTRQRFSLGGRGGAWAHMEVSVNSLIEDLLWPIQDVTRTIAAVAKGDLSQTMSLEVEGRPLEGAFLRSATIVNTMIEQLSVFSSEVTRVAREVGTEGKLGGQAKVKGVSGVWRELTESVNQMASNLTGRCETFPK